MANWTVATCLERLGEVLKEEGLLDGEILDADDETSNDYDIKLGVVVDVMKDRIVKDQFLKTPKLKPKPKPPKPEA